MSGSGSDQHATSSVVITRKPNTSEPQSRCVPGGYHPVNVGEIYNQRYQVIRKLGWGRNSTVWLVRDVRTQSLAAMKIIVADFSVPEIRGDWDEPGILKIVQERNPRSEGCRYICQLLDNFTHEGPNGAHICLVFEAMDINVLELDLAYPDAWPVPLIKRISKHLLRALLYLHEECGIVHTDIKGDNILLISTPPIEAQPIVELSYEDLMHATFKISDFGSANLISNHYTESIQPELLRAPEVLLGAEWDEKVDIWNLGCLISEFATGFRLFNPNWDNANTKMSPVETHIAQICGLCGDFPSDLLERAPNAKLYFDDKGALLKDGGGQFVTDFDELLGPMTGHSSKDIAEIGAFLSSMIVIDPRKRSSARSMLDHSWLAGVE